MFQFGQDKCQQNRPHLIIALFALLVSGAFGELYANTENKISAKTNDNKVIRLSQPFYADKHTETFGKEFDSSLPKTTLVNLIANSEKNLNKKMLIETKVAKVCQKKGCFFIAQQEDVLVRVSFENYEFFIPTDSSNKSVQLNGKLISKNLTDEQAAHFNSDLKMDSVFKPGEVYEIVASSIQIPRS